MIPVCLIGILIEHADVSDETLSRYKLLALKNIRFCIINRVNQLDLPRCGDVIIRLDLRSEVEVVLVVVEEFKRHIACFYSTILQHQKNTNQLIVDVFFPIMWVKECLRTRRHSHIGCDQCDAVFQLAGCG